MPAGSGLDVVELGAIVVVEVGASPPPPPPACRGVDVGEELVVLLELAVDVGDGLVSLLVSFVGDGLVSCVDVDGGLELVDELLGDGSLDEEGGEVGGDVEFASGGVAGVVSLSATGPPSPVSARPAMGGAFGTHRPTIAIANTRARGRPQRFRTQASAPMKSNDEVTLLPTIPFPYAVRLPPETSPPRPLFLHLSAPGLSLCPPIPVVSKVCSRPTRWKPRVRPMSK